MQRFPEYWVERHEARSCIARACHKTVIGDGNFKMPRRVCAHVMKSIETSMGAMDVPCIHPPIIGKSRCRRHMNAPAQERRGQAEEGDAGPEFCNTNKERGEHTTRWTRGHVAWVSSRGLVLATNELFYGETRVQV